MSAKSARAEIRWFGLLTFIGHLALLALGFASLWRIAGGLWLGALVGALFAVAYALLWRFLLAPGSRQRLGFPERLATTLVAGIGVLILGSLGAVWLPALIALSVVLMGDTLDERSAQASPSE